MKTDYTTFCEGALILGASAEPPKRGNEKVLYGFHLTFSATRKHIFCFDTEVAEHVLPDGKVVQLRAILADKLVNATKFICSATGYATKELARQAGETLRGSLVVVNVGRALGLVFDYSDVGPPEPWYAIQNPGEFVDGVQASVNGLYVYPADVVIPLIDGQGTMRERAANPEHIFEAVNMIWHKARPFSNETQAAVDLSNASVREPLPRAAFLLAYASLTTLVPRSRRSKESLELLSNLKNVVDASRVPKAEKDSLKTALGNLREESPKAAFKNFFEAESVNLNFDGESPIDVVLKAYEIRNSLSHPKKDSLPPDVEKITGRLRTIVFWVIANRNGLIPIHWPKIDWVEDLNDFKIGPV